MRILTRYVLFEFLKVFFITLAATTLMMMVVGVAVEAKQQGIGLKEILKILPYILPDALRFSVPGTTLFAACSVYGRLASSNEVVATKALGISPMVLLWPVLIFSLVLSFGSVLLNEIAVTWGRSGVQRVILESVEQIAYGMLRTQRSYSTDSMAMNVQSVEGRRLINPTLTINASGDSQSITITADEAELRSDLENSTLTIRFQNAIIDVGDKGGVNWPGPYEHVIQLGGFDDDPQSRGPSKTPISQIGSSMDRQLEKIKNLEQHSAAEAAFAMMTGEVHSLAGGSWKQRSDKIATAQRKYFRLRTEPYRRWANGVSCLFFAFVGAPMSIRLRKGEFLTSFFVCFLPILLVYYPLLITGVDRAKSGDWPSISVWLGNLILAVWGLWLLRRVIRY